MRQASLFGAMVAMALVLLACAGGPSGPPPPGKAEGPPAETPTAAPLLPTPPRPPKGAEGTPAGGEAAPKATPPPPEAQVPAAAEAAVGAAKEDLVKRAALTPEEIKVTGLEAVQWPSTALGCPQPGMMYAQVITPGYRVLLQARGQTYKYHTDAGRWAVLCP